MADGITEDIITDLSRFRDLDVIARNSTFIYKGKPVDVREIGRELNVGYVLEGSLQRQGDQIRVTAQLIDARTGAHVWSNRWDRATQDIFAVQSEVSERVASRLGGVLSLGAITTAEVQRARRRAPADLTAYEHYLLAAEAKGQRTPATTRTGLSTRKRRLPSTPALARAYGIRGWLRYFTISDGTDWASTMEQVGADFRRAVALYPMDAEAWVALGGYLVEMGRFAEGAAELTRAVELSPMHGHVLAVAAAYLPWAGKPEEAVALADRALRLDPHMTPANLGGVSEAYFFARRFDRAVEIINSIPAASRSRGKLLLLTLSYAFLVRKEEAAAAKAEFVGRYGTVSAEQLANEGFVFARPEEESLFRDGFGKAGLPICATDEQLAKYSKPKRLPECART